MMQLACRPIPSDAAIPGGVLQSIFPQNGDSALNFDHQLKTASAKLGSSLGATPEKQTFRGSEKFEIAKQGEENQLRKTQIESQAAQKETLMDKETLQKLLINFSVFDPRLLSLVESLSKLEAAASKIDLNFLVEQIVEQSRLIKTYGKTELQLTLKPENLGSIWLSVSIEKGIVSVQIAASPTTKEAIDSRLTELEEALKNNQLNIGSLSVSVGNFSGSEPSNSSQLSSLSSLSSSFIEQAQGQGQGSRDVILMDSYSLGFKLGFRPELRVYSQV